MARRRSNTMGNKMKQIIHQQATNDKTTQSMILQQPSTIKVIMRRTSKPSRSVQIPQTLTGSKLFEFVEKEYYIEQDKQIIFFKSQRIQSSQVTRKQTFTFSEKDILHVHNRDLINRESVSVFMQFLNNDYVKFKQAKIEANSNQVIRQLLEDSFIYQIEDMDKYLYVQSGRLINISRSLFQQAIQDDSIILFIPVYEKIGSFLKKLEQREMQILQSRTKLTKRSSLNFVDQLETPDFKKKVRGHVYKSMVLPQSKQVVWQEDSNSEFSKKILLKRLNKKKNIKPKKKESIRQIIRQSQILSVTSEFSSSPRYSKDGEKDLQNFKIIDKSRLFCSQILPKRNDLSNFKPPPAMLNNDDDFDEVQQMDFGCHSNDEDDEDECMDNCNGRQVHLKVGKSPVPMHNSLTKSVGKARGDFRPFLQPVLAMSNNKSDSDDSDG